MYCNSHYCVESIASVERTLLCMDAGGTPAGCRQRLRRARWKIGLGAAFKGHPELSSHHLYR